MNVRPDPPLKQMTSDLSIVRVKSSAICTEEQVTPETESTRVDPLLNYRKITCRNSYEFPWIWGFGHQAPEACSFRILKLTPFLLILDSRIVEHFPPIYIVKRASGELITPAIRARNNRYNEHIAYAKVLIVAAAAARAPPEWTDSVEQNI